MFRHSKAIEDMFSSREGSSIYKRILTTLDKEKMTSLIDGGVLLGFSGGADSVLLLCFLCEYKRREEKAFSILATHVNHSIRGDEADRDEQFAKDFAKGLDIEFRAVSIDVPAISKRLGIGIEEAARNARYSIFDEIIASRNDISAIAVAHNATDNTETVIMNILRGSGLSGASGIKPVRDNVVRPLISISKSEILALLDNSSIPYVTDSTNLSSDYSRNYVRNEILPLLSRLCENTDASFTRLTENLRVDLDYLNNQSEEFIARECENSIKSASLRELHPALFARVLTSLIHTSTGEYPEEKHITALRELMMSDNFRYSLPGDKDFVCQRGICVFLPKKSENSIQGQIFSLTVGENKISGTNPTVFVGDTDKTSLNVYKFSIQAYISSDIINDSLFLRFKKDGDAYKYSGITHKLKKVFNDKNIPPMERDLIPILCDSEGIALVPGLPARDSAKSDTKTSNTPITFAYSVPADGETEVFTALARK